MEEPISRDATVNAEEVVTIKAPSFVRWVRYSWSGAYAADGTMRRAREALDYLKKAKWVETENDPNIPDHVVATAIQDGDAYRQTWGFRSRTQTTETTDPETGEKTTTTEYVGESEHSAYGCACYVFRISDDFIEKDNRITVSIDGLCDRWLNKGVYIAAAISDSDYPVNFDGKTLTPDTWYDQPGDGTQRGPFIFLDPWMLTPGGGETTMLDNPAFGVIPEGLDPPPTGTFTDDDKWWTRALVQTEYEEDKDPATYLKPLEESVTLYAKRAYSMRDDQMDPLYPNQNPFRGQPTYLHVFIAVVDYQHIREYWSEGGALLYPDTLVVKGKGLVLSDDNLPIFWENEQTLRQSGEFKFEGDETATHLNNFQVASKKYVDGLNPAESAGVAYALYQPPLEARCRQAPMSYTEYGFLTGQIPTYDRNIAGETMAWGFDALSPGNLVYNTGTAIQGLAAGIAGKDSYRKCFGGMAISYNRKTCANGEFGSLVLYISRSNPLGLEYRLSLYTSGLVPLAETSAENGVKVTVGTGSAAVHSRQYLAARTLNPWLFPYKALEGLDAYAVYFQKLGTAATTDRDKPPVGSDDTSIVMPLTAIDEWRFKDNDSPFNDTCGSAAEFEFELPKGFRFNPLKESLVLILSIYDAHGDDENYPEDTFVCTQGGHLVHESALQRGAKSARIFKSSRN